MVGADGCSYAHLGLVQEGSSDGSISAQHRGGIVILQQQQPLFTPGGHRLQCVCERASLSLLEALKSHCPT